MGRGHCGGALTQMKVAGRNREVRMPIEGQVGMSESHVQDTEWVKPSGKGLR